MYIIITGQDDGKHIEAIRTVLERLQSYGLRITIDKCKFLQDSVEYLGHVIDKNGLHKSAAKVEALLTAPAPCDTTQLRSFLGMLQYYNKFIPNLASITQPLNQLLCQEMEMVREVY